MDQPLPAVVSSSPMEEPVRRRRIIRAVSVAVIAVGLLYAALPLWLPTGWIADRLSEQFSVALNRKVHIERISVGWIRGVVIHNLTIADEPGGLLARVGAVRFDLAPVAMLLEQKVRELEVSKPEIWLVENETGRWNVEGLSFDREGRLPSLNYTVRGLLCHARTPEVSQDFRIDRLDLQLEPRTGNLHLASVTRVERATPEADEPTIARLSVDANVKVPRLKKTEKLDGDITIEWSDLALTDLPVPLISRLPVEQVDGTTTGLVTIHTHADLGIDYTLDIAFDGVKIMRQDIGRPAQVPDADLHCSGSWNPNDDMLCLDTLSYETPALRVHKSVSGDRPALRIDKLGDTFFEFNAAGEVKDWPALCREFPEVEAYARQVGLKLEGSAGFVAEVTQTWSEDRFHLELNGDRSELVWRDAEQTLCRLRAGSPKQLRMVLVHDTQHPRLAQPEFELSLGDTTVRSRWDIALPDAAKNAQPGQAPDAGPTWLVPWLQVARTLRGTLDLDCPDADALFSYFPCLRYPGLSGKGPIQLRGEIQPGDGASVCVTHLVLPAEAAWKLGQSFNKPAGEPVEARLTAHWPHDLSGRCKPGFSAEMAYGSSRASVATVDEELASSLRFNGIDDAGEPLLSEVQIVVPLRWELFDIQHLATLCPQGWDWLVSRCGLALRGSVEMMSDHRFVYSPGDMLIRNRVRLTTDDLDIACADRFSKPAGIPLAAEAGQQTRIVEGRREHSFDVTLSQPSGSIHADVTFAGLESSNRQDDFEQVQWRCDVGEIADWLRLFPNVQSRLRAAQPSGALAIRAENTSIGTWQSGKLVFDATKTDLPALAEGGFTKPAGVPAAGELDWQIQPASDDARLYACRLRSGSMRLADAELTSFDADLTLAAAWMADLLHHRPEFPVLTRADVAARGHVDFTGALGRLLPAWQKAIERYQLSGRGDWEADLQADGDEAVVSARVDGGALTFTVPLEHSVLRGIRKPAGLDAGISVLATIDDWRSMSPRRMELLEALVHVADNVVNVYGTVRAPSSTRPADADDLQLAADFDLPQLGPLVGLAIVPLIENVAGRVTGSCTWTGPRNSPRLSSSTVEISGLTATLAGHPLAVEGTARLQNDTLDIEQMHWMWGDSTGALSTVMNRGDDRLDGRVGVNLPRLDVPDLTACYRDALARFAPPEGSATSAPAERERQAREVVDRLKRCDIHLDAGVGVLRTPLPLGIEMTADAAVQTLTIKDGQIEMDFGCLVDGGDVAGKVTADLTADDPAYRLTYTANQIQPGTIVDAYLRRTFPGMVATGPLTLIDESNQMLFPAPGEPNFETGKGELIIEGGTVAGRAAPLWMTKIFPRLNLASYEFSYMHSWFEKSNVGRVQHQMIYQGDYYNVYMIGYSDPGGRFNYEVGIDFLARWDSQYWADSGQGRVPLFNKTGRVNAQGDLENEEVTFVPLRRVGETLFVRNNPVVTAYYAVRKRVTEAK